MHTIIISNTGNPNDSVYVVSNASRQKLYLRTKKSFQRPVSKIGPDFGCLSYAYKTGGEGLPHHILKSCSILHRHHTFVCSYMLKKLHVFTIL